MGLREPFNAATHGLAVPLSILGLVYLVYQAQGTLATAATATYGTSLTLLYVASTLHHSVPGDHDVFELFQRFDHTAIFLLIAGTYTPVALLALPDGWGWTLFGIVWALTAVGIVTRNVYFDMPRWFVVSIYLAMGWTALVALKPIFTVFSWEGIAWLAGGGLAYTIGAIVYATEWPDPMPEHVGAHGVWHLFVLAGSAAHFIFIAGHVPLG